jgi:hypothetical protein
MMGDFPLVAYDLGIRYEWIPDSNLTGLRRYSTHAHAPLVSISPGDDGQTSATAALLAGRYGPTQGRLIGMVRSGGKRFLLFRLTPLR